MSTCYGYYAMEETLLETQLHWSTVARPIHVVHTWSSRGPRRPWYTTPSMMGWAAMRLGIGHMI